MNAELLLTALVDAFASSRPVDLAFFRARRASCMAYGIDFYEMELALVRALAARYVDMSEPHFHLES